MQWAVLLLFPWLSTAAARSSFTYLGNDRVMQTIPEDNAYKVWQLNGAPSDAGCDVFMHPPLMEGLLSLQEKTFRWSELTPLRDNAILSLDSKHGSFVVLNAREREVAETEPPNHRRCQNCPASCECSPAGRCLCMSLPPSWRVLDTGAWHGTSNQTLSELSDNHLLEFDRHTGRFSVHKQDSSGARSDVLVALAENQAAVVEGAWPQLAGHDLSSASIDGKQVLLDMDPINGTFSIWGWDPSALQCTSPLQEYSKLETLAWEDRPSSTPPPCHFPLTNRNPLVGPLRQRHLAPGAKVTAVGENRLLDIAPEPNAAVLLVRTAGMDFKVLAQQDMAAAPVDCGIHERADSCVAVKGCGWCASGSSPSHGVCMRGGANGPCLGHCTEWATSEQLPLVASIAPIASTAPAPVPLPVPAPVAFAAGAEPSSGATYSPSEPNHLRNSKLQHAMATMEKTEQDAPSPSPHAQVLHDLMATGQNISNDKGWEDEPETNGTLSEGEAEEMSAITGMKDLSQTDVDKLLKAWRNVSHNKKELHTSLRGKILSSALASHSVSAPKPCNKPNKSTSIITQDANLHAKAQKEMVSARPSSKTVLVNRELIP